MPRSRAPRPGLPVSATAGMLGLGLGIRLRSLWPIEPRVLLLAVLSTAVAAGTPLAVLLATG